jgi:hypothetical protein
VRKRADRIARFLVSPQGKNLADRVRSITAVRTPHDGTPIADHFLEAEQLQEKVLGLEREFPDSATV